ncbi:MAG: peptide ABC transporter substrate-binding protein [Candidatus Eremiobacteraeota bacterium]|nr:peptide ABC transporter substrate-binding protein [Candidatus Eremiobacteraeota bacterium]
MKHAWIALAALILLPACSRVNAASAETRANAWTTPHVLTISDGGDADTLNPHLTQFATTANLSELTMAWLIRWDAHNVPYPELATEVPTQANGGVSRDGLTITYHLRKGVTWSDGAPFDADDVAFSTAAVNNPANDEGVRFDMISKVDEPDKYTIVYHLKKPMSTSVEAFFSSCCANPCLLPKHLLAKYPNINHVPYNDLPVGIGPFVFQRWDRHKQIVLVANQRYWRGRPRLDKIVYEIVPDRTALLGRLQAHRVDMWYQFGGAYLPKIQTLSGYRIYRQPSYAYDHYDFNITHPVVAELTVRQALRLGLDRRGLVQSVAHGVGVVQDSATPVNAPYFVDLGATPYDPVEANAMLDRAGWRRGSDGIRSKNGVRLVLDMAVSGQASTLDKTIDFVRNDWQKIGVGLNVRHYPQPKFFAPAQQGGIAYGNSWDVETFAWAADPMGDYSGQYGCKALPPAGFNALHWCDRAADAAMNALNSHYEQAQRTADVRTAMEAFVRDVPSIVSDLRVDLFAYNADLKNYHPNNITPFDNMMDVDI